MTAILGRVFDMLDIRVLEEYTRPAVDELHTEFGLARNVPRLILPSTPRRNNCLGNMQLVNLAPTIISNGKWCTPEKKKEEENKHHSSKYNYYLSSNIM